MEIKMFKNKLLKMRSFKKSLYFFKNDDLISVSMI